MANSKKFCNALVLFSVEGKTFSEVVEGYAVKSNAAPKLRNYVNSLVKAGHLVVSKEGAEDGKRATNVYAISEQGSAMLAAIKVKPEVFVKTLNSNSATTTQRKTKATHDKKVVVEKVADKTNVTNVNVSTITSEFQKLLDQYKHVLSENQMLKTKISTAAQSLVV